MTIANLNVTNLPTSTPVFPLSGVLLLPRGQLPLNIFEPRYRNMTQDALSGDGIIGMVQPVSPEEVPMTSEGRIKNLDGERLSLYTAGCAGRIVSHQETPDGGYLIVLEGISRFRLGDEIETIRKFSKNNLKKKFPLILVLLSASCSFLFFNPRNNCKCTWVWF